MVLELTRGARRPVELMQTSKSCWTKFAKHARRLKNAQTDDEVKKIEARLDTLQKQLNDLVADYKKKVVELEKTVADWASQGKKDSPPSEAEKENVSKSLTGLFGFLPDVAKKLFSLPFEILGKILKLFGLGGGTEYKDAVVDVATKALTGQPITPPDIKKVLDGLKGDEQKQAQALGGIDSLRKELANLKGDYAKAAESLRNSAAVHRKELFKDKPEPVQNLLSELERTNASAITAAQIKEIVAPTKEFLSRLIKEATLSALDTFSGVPPQVKAEVSAIPVKGETSTTKG